MSPTATWRLAALILFLMIVSLPAFQRSASELQREEGIDYFERWLRQDVLYIITPEERAVFERLTTAEEKEQFIEQFWFRRDPDPRTAHNEFKEEHYRRIAYANDRFSVGQPGWMSDRGRVYIVHGPPDQIESRPMGGQHVRPRWQGGGLTQTYPHEVWRYRYIEGMGQDVEVEFVDSSLSGQYRLALHPDEKDVFLHLGNAGLTLDEILARQQKRDRPVFAADQRREGYQRRQDSPFERYLRFEQILQPQPITFTDLQRLVRVDVTYDEVPFRVRGDYFRLSEDRVLVPITLEVEDRDLSFRAEGAEYVADLAVYGIITNLSNRIVFEFEDELQAAYPAAHFERTPARGRSLYQKVVPLDARMRYRLDVVVKDLGSGRVGVRRQALLPPAYTAGLAHSSLWLSDHIQIFEEVPRADQMFVLGDVWIRPALEGTFTAGETVGLYLQVYNAAVDQAVQAPSLEVRYRIQRDGRTVVELIDSAGDSIQFFSEQRVVLIRALPTEDLLPGSYQVEVEVEDRVSGSSLRVQEPLEIRAAG